MTPRPSRIFDTVLPGVLRTALLFSLLLLFAGHNAPGGGFVGGLTAGAALLLLYAAGGTDAVDRLIPVSEGAFLGAGVVVATAVGLGGFAWAGTFLGSVKIETDFGVLGTLKATSALPFDVGVYLVVVGLSLAILRALGADGEDAEVPGRTGEPGAGSSTEPAAPLAPSTDRSGERGGA